VIAECRIFTDISYFYIKKKTLICRVFFIDWAFKLWVQQRFPQRLSLLLNPLSILRPSAQQLLLQWQQRLKCRVSKLIHHRVTTQPNRFGDYRRG
jgi:hypothetical protein